MARKNANPRTANPRVRQTISEQRNKFAKNSRDQHEKQAPAETAIGAALRAALEKSGQR